jgi:hypothetical protein
MFEQTWTKMIIVGDFNIEFNQDSPEKNSSAPPSTEGAGDMTWGDAGHSKIWARTVS